MTRHILWPLFSMVLLASFLALPASVRARSAVVHSAPADGAVLAAGPQMLQVWFDNAAIIEPGAVSLSDASGRSIAVVGVHSDFYRPGDAGLQAFFDPTFLFLCSLGLGSYPTTLMVDLPVLGPGTYRLNWRVITIKDRLESSGSLVFAVDPQAPQAAGDALTHSVSTQADDLMVTMGVRPNRPGANFISLQTAAIRRPLRAPIDTLTLRLSSPGQPPREVAVIRAPDGSYLASGELIDQPGTWIAEVQIGRGPQPATAVRLIWDVPAQSSPGQPLAWWLSALAGLILLAGFGFGLRRRTTLRRQ